MKTIQAPTGPCIDVFDEVVGNMLFERRALLQECKPRIEKTYDDYAEKRGALVELRPCSGFTVDEEKALRACYGNRGTRLRRLQEELRENLRESSTDVCPYCGLDFPTTTDHYLPDSRFPEFSVCTDNLIPCCSPCNTARNNRDWQLAEGCGTIHVYFEPVDETTPFVDVDLKQDVARFEVRQDPAGFASRLTQHWEALGLKKRFGRAAARERDKLIEWAALLLARDETRAEERLTEHCGNQAEIATRRLGSNSWEASFYTAVTGCPAFMQRILEKGAQSS